MKKEQSMFLELDHIGARLRLRARHLVLKKEKSARPRY